MRRRSSSPARRSRRPGRIRAGARDPALDRPLLGEERSNPAARRSARAHLCRAARRRDRDACRGVVHPARRVVRGGSTGASTSLETGSAPADVPLVVQVSRWDRSKDMAGVMTRVRGAHRSVARRAPTALRARGHGRCRRPGGGRGARRVHGALAAATARRAEPRSPRLHPDGGSRRERGDRERDPAPRRGRRPEEPRRGLRPDGRGGDVEAKGRSSPVRSAASSTRSRTARMACSCTIRPTSERSAPPSSRCYGMARTQRGWAKRPQARDRRVPRRPAPRAVRPPLRAALAQNRLKAVFVRSASGACLPLRRPLGRARAAGTLHRRGGLARNRSRAPLLCL